MTSARLQQLMERPELMSRDTLYELRTLLTRFPYTPLLRLLYLKNLYLLHDAGFGAELRRSIIYISDRRQLFTFVEGFRYELKPMRAKSSTDGPSSASVAPADRTLSLIDSFLAGNPDEHIPLGTLPTAMDYTPFLTDGDEGPNESAPPLQGQSLIDNFLDEDRKQSAKTDGETPLASSSSVSASSSSTSSPSSSPSASPTSEPAAELPNEPLADDDTSGIFTETLARIYVKQRKYDKALEIIKKLSVLYPKKSSYFAVQIRFLEKVITNSKS